MSDEEALTVMPRNAFMRVKEFLPNALFLHIEQHEIDGGFRYSVAFVATTDQLIFADIVGPFLFSEEWRVRVRRTYDIGFGNFRERKVNNSG